MTLSRRTIIAGGSGLAMAGLASNPARAEIAEVVIAQQFGAVYLPAMIMEDQKLVEKHLAAAALPTKVRWAKLGGPAAINDATIAGSLHFACQGIPSLAVIADRTRANIGVRALGSMVNANIWLNTRNPAVKSLRDFTEKDRIAIPSLKVSTQAIMLHIACEQIWGKGQHAKLDHIITALPHPEALAAVTSASHEVNSHFATTPFHEGEMKAGLKTVTSVYEIMGGPSCGLTFTSNEKFRKENPKVFEAVSKAFDESFLWINADKKRAAEKYVEMTKEKRLTVEELAAVMATPDLEYTKVPSKTMKMLTFLHDIGSVKTKPDSWKDFFFPEAHGLAGS